MILARSLPAGAPGVQLRCEGLAASSGGRRLFGDLGVVIRAGERWAIVGSNGSGKSTLLHVLAGLRMPDEGSVLLREVAYGRWDPRSAARVRGLLVQGASYAFRTRVADAVMLGRHPHVGRFGWPGAQDDRCVDAAMQVMDVSGLADRDVLSLSGGEQQRTRLAALLAQDPSVLLLDEPTTHLDLGHQSRFFAHLVHACESEGKCAVYATHELTFAARCSTHAIVLDGRGGAMSGTAADVLRADVLSAAFGHPIDAVGASCSLAFVPR